MTKTWEITYNRNTPGIKIDAESIDVAENGKFLVFTKNGEIIAIVNALAFLYARELSNAQEV